MGRLRRNLAGIGIRSLHPSTLSVCQGVYEFLKTFHRYVVRVLSLGRAAAPQDADGALGLPTTSQHPLIKTFGCSGSPPIPRIAASLPQVGVGMWRLAMFHGEVRPRGLCIP